MDEDNPREGRNGQQAEVEDHITEITSTDTCYQKDDEWESYSGPDKLQVDV